jgi:hypothetical protein
LVYWYCTPMILENHPEKCSGWFVHDWCHHMVLWNRRNASEDVSIDGVS